MALHRRDLLRFIEGLLASGWLEAAGAGAATISLVAGSGAVAQPLPPAPPNPLPPPTTPDPAQPAPTPTSAPTPDPTKPEEPFGLGGLQRNVSDAVTEMLNALNEATYDLSKLPSPSHETLDSLGGLTFNVGISGHAEGPGYTSSTAVGVVGSFNPFTGDYAASGYKTQGAGGATTNESSSSAGIEAGLGSGPLSEFFGESHTTTGTAGFEATSVTTNQAFAAVGVGLSLPPPTYAVSVTVERTNTAPFGPQTSGNIYSGAQRATTALLNVGDAIMSQVP